MACTLLFGSVIGIVEAHFVRRAQSSRTSAGASPAVALQN
jgi:hypothetical protein